MPNTQFEKIWKWHIFDKFLYKPYNNYVFLIYKICLERHNDLGGGCGSWLNVYILPNNADYLYSSINFKRYGGFQIVVKTFQSDHHGGFVIKKRGFKTKQHTDHLCDPKRPCIF
jgi:hypothetical protein